MVLQDRRVKAHELGSSAGIVSSIIHSVLNMARMLTPEQKACHQQFNAMETQVVPYSQEILVQQSVE